MVEHLIRDKSHEQSSFGLEHLIPSNDLEGQLRTFLVACRVDGLKKDTIRFYREKVGPFIKFCRQQFGIIRPEEVTIAHIRLFQLKLQATNNPTSIRDYHRSIKRFFNWLIEEELLENSPMAKLRPPRKEDKLIEPFTDEHLNRLLTCCDERTFIGARNMAMLLTFLDTGMRLREMTDNLLTDIDFEREVIKVRGKGARERIVRIGRRTQKAILKYLVKRKDQSNALWVSQTGQALGIRGIQIMVNRLGKRAGVKNVRCSPHTFRHSFGTRALLNGADITDVQSILGHKTLDMTRRYLATINSEQAAARHHKFSPVDNLGK